MNREQVREAVFEKIEEAVRGILSGTGGAKCAELSDVDLDFIDGATDAIMALDKPPTEAYGLDSQTASRPTVTRAKILRHIRHAQEQHHEPHQWDRVGIVARERICDYLTAAGVNVEDE